MISKVGIGTFVRSYSTLTSDGDRALIGFLKCLLQKCDQDIRSSRLPVPLRETIGKLDMLMTMYSFIFPLVYFSISAELKKKETQNVKVTESGF